MSLPSEIRRAARDICGFAIGAAIGLALGVLLGLMPVAAAASGWWMGTAGFTYGLYRGETQTVERIRSYLHRENR